MPGSGLHRYIVVIFEQQRQLLLSSDDDDDDDTLSSSYEGILKSLSTSKRSEFDLKVIAEELHLKSPVCINGFYGEWETGCEDEIKLCRAVMVVDDEENDVGVQNDDYTRGVSCYNTHSL